MSKAKTESLGRSSGKISLATAGSRVTGLLRETVFAYLLGGSLAADAYFAATRLPNLLRDLFAEGALGSAFVPVLSDALARGEVEQARRLVRSMAFTLAWSVGLVVTLCIVFSPFLVAGLAPGFAQVPGKVALTAELVRWTFPYLWVVSLAALVAGTLNSLRRFGIPAAAPIFFNIGHIATALLFWKVFDPPVLALAVGVLLGSSCQLLFQWPALKREGFSLFGPVALKDPLVGRVLRLLLPAVLGLATLQLNNLATTVIASFLAEGSLAHLNYAFRLMHFPLGVFAVAVGTAVLPRASESVARGERDVLASTFGDGLRLAAFLVIPAALFLVAFPREIVRVVYEHGAFDLTDTEAVSWALRFYALGLLGYTGVRVTAPFFYAHKDTRTPVRYAIAAVIVNVLLNVALARPMGAGGLALANAISGSLNFVLLKRRLGTQYNLSLPRTVWLDLALFMLTGGLATAAAWGVSLLIGTPVGFAQQAFALCAVGGTFVVVYALPVFRRGSAARSVIRQLLKRG